MDIDWLEILRDAWLIYLCPLKVMKKMIKRLKEKFARVDKVFLIGFSVLTIATFDLSFHWFVATIAGYSFVWWQMKYGMWKNA